MSLLNVVKVWVAKSRMLVLVVLVISARWAVANDASCAGYNTSPISNELRYTGPDQVITREGKMNFRCFQGQHYEDLYMFQHHLNQVGGGFFLEIGALDGYSYSVTYFFEQFLHWDGLLIEASPKNHQLFKARMRKMKPGRRRRVPFVPAAACNEPMPLRYVAKEGTGAGLFEFMPKSEQDRVMKEGCTAVNDTESAEEVLKKTSCALIPVQCVNLGDELKKRRVSHIDLFILDVQGAELGVMQTLPLEDIPVRYFLIELDGTGPEKDAAVRCILRKHNYRPIGRLDLNELWEHPHFPAEKFKYHTPGTQWKGCLKQTNEPWLKSPALPLTESPSDVVELETSVSPQPPIPVAVNVADADADGTSDATLVLSLMLIVGLSFLVVRCCRRR